MSDIETDKSIILASEKVQARNIEACIAHCNATRELFRELEKEVQSIRNQLLTSDTRYNGLNARLASVQNILGAGGTEPSDQV